MAVTVPRPASLMGPEPWIIFLAIVFIFIIGYVAYRVFRELKYELRRDS